MPNKLTVVIDTNVLLVAVSDRSQYHWLFQMIVENKLEVFITNEILSEYAEKILERLDLDSANNALKMLTELENVHQTIVHYNFELIKNDPDDNKFVDCAIAANVDFLITNDKHFNVLKDVAFPKINVMRLEEFEKIIVGEKNFEINFKNYKILADEEGILLFIDGKQDIDMDLGWLREMKSAAITHFSGKFDITKEIIYKIGYAIQKYYPLNEINWVYAFESVEFYYYSEEVYKLERPEGFNDLLLHFELSTEQEIKDGVFRENAISNLKKNNIRF